MIRTLFQKISNNLSYAKFNRRELSGSLGDLGTFLPIILGLAYVTGLSFSAMLFWSGAANILTGLVFAIPMPVQPMKAIAAVALSGGMSADEVYASGIIMAVLLILIWRLKLPNVLEKFVPKAVVRGIQLSIGLRLLIKGIDMIYLKPLIGYDSVVVGVLGLLFVLALYKNNRIPTALIIFICGLSIAILSDFELLKSLKAGLFIPGLININFSAFSGGLFSGAIPQLPLTMLNSVIAVSALSYDLFPKRGADTGNITLSVGLLNFASFFGGMPMCHGSGGLAAQSRFGAETNGSIIFLGTAKILIAVVLGASIVPLISAFPESLLGVLLIVAGIELGSAVKDQRGLRNLLTIFILVAVSFVFGSLTAGFLLALAASKSVLR